MDPDGTPARATPPTKTATCWAAAAVQRWRVQPALRRRSLTRPSTADAGFAAGAIRGSVAPMSPEDRVVVEGTVRAAVAQGDVDGAADIVVRRFGPEILGFLYSVTRDEGLAGDSFSVFCEDVWKGLGKFRFESSLRTWLFTLARNAASRTARAPQRKREVPVEGGSAIDHVVQEVRASTMRYLKTEVKDSVRKLREALSPDDQTLLVLRIDKKLEWDEIARVMLDEGEDPTPAAHKKKAATLRKRFERVKERLRELATADGLLAPR